MKIEKLVELLETHLQIKSLKDFQVELLNEEIDISQKNIEFSEDHYCRNLIFRNKVFEIYIIGWKPNQETKYHRHPENGCLMTVLKGLLIEYIKTDNNIITYNRKIGDCSYIHDEIGIHKIKNNKDTESITLHIYSPPKFYN